MKKMAFLIIISFVFMVFSLALAADIPMMLNYQGYVEYYDGTPINDNGYFKFAIVDPNGNTTYWSNDGTSSTGDEPVNAVMIPVTNGVFTVKLGNTDMTNMSALPTTVFDQQNIYARVWFSDDEETNFDLLSPDTQIVSAGFAYKAQSVVNGAVTSTVIQDETITSADIKDASIMDTDVGFNYAGSTSAGGPASNLDCVECVSQNELDFTPATGDITSVTAGTGLTGGGTSGDVTLSVNTGTIQSRVSGTCTPGSSIRAINADGTVTCETVDNSGGDITAVTAGTGLTGGGTSGDVTLSVNTGAIQSRVSGTCTPGSSIRAINADGSVTCETDNDFSFKTCYIKKVTVTLIANEHNWAYVYCNGTDRAISCSSYTPYGDVVTTFAGYLDSVIDGGDVPTRCLIAWTNNSSVTRDASGFAVCCP